MLCKLLASPNIYNSHCVPCMYTPHNIFYILYIYITQRKYYDIGLFSFDMKIGAKCI